jgi:NADPH-dependent 2,4-dienoyl-CoA reductase/sulfur reductase-like enzyme
LGRERECRIEPARRAKRVVVVGGGPGGMEAARVAALRGHDVVLYEKEDRLGGQLVAASVPGFKKPLGDLLDYLRNQVERGRVKVQLGYEATPDVIKAATPEVVVLATGASHAIPDMPGADGGNVATACDVLLGKCECGSRVAVVGGGEVGCELAWFLAERGAKVTVVEMAFGLAMDVNLFSRFYLLEKLAELGVAMLPMTTAKEIVTGGVIVANASGDTQVVEADTVVLATGFSPNTGLEVAALGGGVEVYSIGDCVQPGKVQGAIHTAWRVAMRI